MREFSRMPIFHSALVWVLVAFFIIGGTGNIFASGEILADYQRWGYPDWFHYVTGASELTTSALLILRRTRLFGAALGCAVMLAAALTVAVDGEYLHAVAPIIVLAFSALALRLTWTTFPLAERVNTFCKTGTFRSSRY